MTAAPNIHHQRSRGEVLLRVEAKGLARMREAGAAKVRFPQGGKEAILINTGGGLAGGDDFTFDISAGPASTLSVTTQAAERVYRSTGPAATVKVRLAAEAGSTLRWLPQESILFDGSSLSRHLEAEIANDATLLAVESVILGRTAMGEKVAQASFHDRWRIRKNGELIFADDMAIDGPPPATQATLGEARALATVVMISDRAEAYIGTIRDLIGASGSASAWSGKLVARFLARDGFDLRKALIPVLSLLSAPATLPKVWSL